MSFNLFQLRCFLTLGLVAVSYAQDLIADLKARGIEVTSPRDDVYDDARAAYNRRFDFSPAAITYPQSPHQVSAVVQLANRYHYRVAARSGGHSYIANGLGGQDGAVIIDLNRHFNHIRVDSTDNTALIESGNRLGDIALTLNNYGRALPHGTCPYVGIGGHSSFGGWGYTSRQWGLTLDTIMSLNVVLANGTVVTVSESQDSELFWGMRGAGPSFGITTSVRVKTFPTPPSATAFTYMWELNASTASATLGAFQDYALGGIPSELGPMLFISKGSSQGKINLILTGGWYGPTGLLNATLAPFLDKIPQKPQNQTRVVGSYIDSLAQAGLGGLNTTIGPEANNTFYVKSLMTPEDQPMSPRSQHALMEYLASEGFNSELSWLVEVEQYGGPNSAINAVPLNSTAFGSRSSLFTIQFYAYTPNTEPPFPDSGFSFLDRMVDSVVDNNPSNWNYGAYANYLDNRLQNWQHLYFGSHYERLRRLKGVVDPNNFFKFPTSVEQP